MEEDSDKGKHNDWAQIFKSLNLLKVIFDTQIFTTIRWATAKSIFLETIYFHFCTFVSQPEKKKIIFKILKHIIKTNKQANILSPALEGLKFRVF